jgi:hypothetical protein
MAKPSPTFIAAVLVGIGAVPNPTNVRALVLWGKTEGGGGRNNPLNTTMPMPGDSRFNPVGVRNYPDERTGVQATIKTLNLDYYVGVRGALRAGSMQDIYDAIHGSPWCGRCCQKGQYPIAFAEAGVRLAPKRICPPGTEARGAWLYWIAGGAVATGLGIWAYTKWGT